MPIVARESYPILIASGVVVTQDGVLSRLIHNTATVELIIVDDHIFHARSYVNRRSGFGPLSSRVTSQGVVVNHRLPLKDINHGAKHGERNEAGTR